MQQGLGGGWRDGWDGRSRGGLLLQGDDHGRGVGLCDTEVLGQGHEGAGGQRREPRWQQGVDPRMGFALDHAEQTPVHHLEGVGLEGDQNEQEPAFQCREGQLW